MVMMMKFSYFICTNDQTHVAAQLDSMFNIITLRNHPTKPILEVLALSQGSYTNLSNLI